MYIYIYINLWLPVHHVRTCIVGQCNFWTDQTWFPNICSCPVWHLQLASSQGSWSFSDPWRLVVEGHKTMGKMWVLNLGWENLQMSWKAMVFEGWSFASTRWTCNDWITLGCMMYILTMRDANVYQIYLHQGWTFGFTRTYDIHWHHFLEFCRMNRCPFPDSNSAALF